jgi:predicted dehydrogenase
MTAGTSAPLFPRPRIGVLSFAHYHANFWSEVFLQRGVLAGIWDDDAARGADAASRFFTTHTTDLDALLERCTAVAICSETSMHPALVERAAARGRAVLCEKPLGATLADCERIATLVRESRIGFMQSFPKRFDPVSHWLRELVAAHELGALSLVRIRHGQYYGLQDDFRSRWYVDPALSGGGALLDEGVHGADLLAWLFGMPHAVTCVTSRATLALSVEDLGVATFEFGSGMLAELTASFAFAAAEASIELYGTKGAVLVSGVDLASRDITSGSFVRRYRHAGPAADREWEIVPITPRFKLGGFHQQNAIAFVDALESGAAFPTSVEDGLRAVKMIMAAYRAAESGTRQRIA